MAVDISSCTNADSWVTSACLAMSEKLCLKWNDFKENVNAAFGNLREDHEFADVTLACEDGEQIEAHKVILAASSPFFQNLLSRSKHPHPLIYMRGIKSETLLAIVDFLYCGQANVYQENLESFLSIADELALRGLMGQNREDREGKEKNLTSKVNPTTQMNTKHFVKKSGEFEGSTQNTVEPLLKEDGPTSESDERSVTLSNFENCDLQELDEKVKSLMEKSQNKIANRAGRASVCKICGKEGQWVAIRDHIETNHLEGVSLPCNICGSVFRS